MMSQYSFSNNKDINTMLNQVVKKINSFVNKQTDHINRLTKIGYSLSSETDINNIFELILEEAINYTNADGATIYTLSPNQQFLEFQLVFNNSLGIKIGGRNGKVNWKSIPLYDDAKPRLKNFVTYVFHTQKSWAIDDVYEQSVFDNSGTIAADKANNYRSKSMIAIPLKNHEGDVLGIIQLINSMLPNGKIQSFTEEHLIMLNSLASQAAISLTNKKLIEGLEKLLQDFVQAIAFTLDKKSKYSGMHITRVALLNKMIANLINETKSGIFADVYYSENQLEEISMSGWLHDIGKIVTPEYVMDKSTKLETIFDRIEVVKLRFEIVRQVLNNMLKDIQLSTKDDKAVAAINDKLALLEDYVQFISKINIGGEFLPDSSLEKLQDILDFEISYDNRKYFLINEEEFMCLSVRKGTLTKDEIKEMQEHVVVTKEILSKLTFPKKYKNVPLFASSHHEKLSGKGYPAGLRAEQLPTQARILAVADVFEALTAADRPYKEGKKLSEALKIMTFMAKDNEIDKEIFKLILRSGLHQEYADKFINKEQIDKVDVDEIIRSIDQVSNK